MQHSLNSTLFVKCVSLIIEQVRKLSCKISSTLAQPAAQLYIKGTSLALSSPHQHQLRAELTCESPASIFSFTSSLALKMPRFLLFCLVSSQLAMTAVMGRPFAVFGGGVGGTPTSIAYAPSSSSSAAAARLHAYSFLESSFAGSPQSPHRRNHSPFDRKFAGGKIILGGLAAAIFAAVFFYIRITRKKKTEPKS
ncbi:hypothetical protein GUJ93_ZPchr0007g3524 [Zizania palustris]|uniref:Transmembrane protein n=1 Tax=Zizania palustris TaxID=103762 RepID=A0A8J5STQ7_ZIZPA|nr:hypothetical protein GUJ93_ZPchr0007g3524 [Zizania palustris]